MNSYTATLLVDQTPEEAFAAIANRHAFPVEPEGTMSSASVCCRAVGLVQGARLSARVGSELADIT